MSSLESTAVSRRDVLTAIAGLGIGTAAFCEAVAVEAKKGGIGTAGIEQAEKIAGITLTDADRKSVAAAVDRAIRDYESMRKIGLINAVSPAVAFQPAPWLPPSDLGKKTDVRMTDRVAPQRPKTDEDLAFLPVTELAALVRTRKVSSVELTKLSLARLKKYDPALKFVVTLTEELALKQAKRADAEIAAGRYRGPLHGIPWGAKDLIAVPGYPTTWGAPQFKDQKLDVTATVARKLDEAGAVLVAKLSLGALAQGDRWFGGRTNCPWYPKLGSSGSSAGSCAAVAAGCVPFALGSETLGSIVSPCRRNGTTGLRPTFGRVSRAGCMTLSWSMDKIGPIARGVEDCAHIFAAIHGFDGNDVSAVDRPFRWPAKRDLSAIRVGYFEGRTAETSLKILRELGVKLVPFALPTKTPFHALRLILYTEAGAVFDELTRTGNLEGINSWKYSFRNAQFVPAVEYLRANRLRTLVMQEMRELMTKVDCYVGGNDLVLTNLTGHPSVVLPTGFRSIRGVELPYSETFTGQLYGEEELLTVAHAFQQKLTAHLKRPPMEKLLEEE